MFVFVPNNPNLQESFTGFTNNPYLYKKYDSMMRYFGVSNLVRGTYDTIKEFIQDLHQINPILMNDNFRSIVGSPVFTTRNRLFGLHGHGINQDLLVINDITYERFGEVFFSTSELRKSLFDIRRLCDQFSVRYIYQYLNMDNDDLIVFMKIIKRIYQFWDMIDKKYQEFGSSIMLMPSLSPLGIGTIFSSIVDEPHYVLMYIASEITKLGLYPLK